MIRAVMADFESLAQDLGNPLPEVRQKAVVGLVEEGDLRALPLLERAAKEDANTQVRFYAKRGLLLLRQRGSGAPATGKAAMASRTVRPVLDPRQVLSRWTSLSVEDRIRAVQQLSAYGDARLLPYYAAILRSEREPFVRSKVCVAIGILGSAEGLSILKTALSDKDQRVRANAVEAIGYIGGEASFPLLFGGLAGPENPRLVRNVQKFLERGNDSAFEEYLKTAFIKGRGVVRDTVIKAVRLLERERLYELLALAVKKDPEGSGRSARSALSELAGQGSVKARSLLDRLDGRPGAAEPAEPAGAEQVRQALGLAGASEAERLERLTALIASGEREKLPHLAVWLRTEDAPKVRSVLVRGIASLAGDRAVKTLLGLLDDPDARVRADAIECLYPYATDPEVARQVAARGSDPNGRVRANALVLLGRIPGQDIQKALSELASSESADDRLRAAYVVLDVERDDATLVIAPLLQDEDQRVRGRASEVLHLLAERGNETAMRLLAGNAPPVESSLRYDPDEFVSSTSIPITPPTAPAPARPSRAAKVQDPASDVSIEHDRLVYMLDSEDEKERLQAVRILEEIGDGTVLEPIRRLMNDRSEEVRQVAARAFCSLKERYGPEGDAAIPDASEDELERLRMRLCHREAKVRHAALREIGPAHRELKAFLLERIALEPDLHVKASMVLSAGMLAGPADVSALAPWLRDEDARVRANAIEALEYAGDTGVVKLISPCLSESSARVRANAAAALRHFDRAKVLEVLNAMARSKQPWQRYGAIAALSELGGTDVLDPLFVLLESEETPQLTVLTLMGIVRIPDPGRAPRLEQLAAATTDPKKKDWLNKAIEALDSGELHGSVPGLEGYIARLRPSVEEVRTAATAPAASSEPEEDEKALERQKLARMVAHLREDLYAKDSKARQEAAVKLGRVEHPAAVRALTVALSHSDKVVKYLARRSLKAMLDKPAIFDTEGDMTHGAVKAAVAKADKEDAKKGPAVGDFNWTVAWAGVLMLMLLLYIVFGRGTSSEDPKPKKPQRPRKPGAGRTYEGGTSSSDRTRLGGGDSRREREPAGSVRLGGGSDERPRDDGLPAAGVVAPAPPSEDGAKPPASGRGEGVRPEEYPQDPPKRSETPPDGTEMRTRGTEKVIEPESGVTDRRDE